MRNITLALLSAIVLAVGCTPRQTASPGAMFWTWLDYRPDQFEEHCRMMDEAGIDGVILNAATPDDYRAAVEVAHAHGIHVFAWIWTLNLEHDRAAVLAEHPDWLSVNRLGESLADHKAYVDHYKFLCPTLPEVRDYLNAKVRAICEVEGVEGIAIDYHRLVDVILPNALWPKYGIVQDREYSEWDYGYHPAMIEKFRARYGYDPREQEDPSADLAWRQFRCDQVTEVANLFAETAHSLGKLMGASPFPTPKMASRMVRQDWGQWDLDIVFPMVYTGFYTFDPQFAYDCTVENMRDKNPRTTLYCGLGIGWEGSPDSIFANMDQAFRGGAQGIAIFTVAGLRDPALRSRFKAYADSLRTVRAAHGGVMPAVDIPAAADKDPFSHEGLMAVIRARMERETGAPVALGAWSPVEAYDATEVYAVTDGASGRTFRVTFYTYGDVVCGWDVR